MVRHIYREMAEAAAAPRGKRRAVPGPGAAPRLPPAPPLGEGCGPGGLQPGAALTCGGWVSAAPGWRPPGAGHGTPRQCLCPGSAVSRDLVREGLDSNRRFKTCNFF